MDLFFKITPETTIIIIEKLRPTRAREDGIENAIKHMYDAFQGNISKRSPINVIPSKDHANMYDIVDGNSTWHVAKKIGIEKLPVIII